MEIILVGNIIYDQIYYIKGLPKLGKSNEALDSCSSIGGIGNCITNLRRIDSDVDIVVCTSVGDDIEGKIVEDYLLYITSNRSNISRVNEVNTSKAVLFVDSYTGEKTSLVDWGACSVSSEYTTFYDNWCHILYLDILHGLSCEYLYELKNNQCILSADLCLSFFDEDLKSDMLKKIALLDYIILSDNEARGLYQDRDLANISMVMGRLVKQFCIIHFQGGSFYSDGTEIYECKAGELQYSDEKIYNIVGAGDAFASSFIYYKLTGFEVSESISMSHDAALNYIQWTNK